MPSPIDSLQSPKELRLPPDPRLAVVDDGEKLDFQMKFLIFSESRERRFRGSRVERPGGTLFLDLKIL